MPLRIVYHVYLLCSILLFFLSFIPCSAGITLANRTPFANILSRFTKVANVSYCKFANISLCQNSETINSPKFYPAKILHYTLESQPAAAWCSSVESSKDFCYRPSNHSVFHFRLPPCLLQNPLPLDPTNVTVDMWGNFV